MEFVTARTLKPSSSISEMVSKLAKVCKLRSVGVFFNENPNRQSNNHQVDDINVVLMMDEDSSNVTEEVEGNGERIHPRPDVVISKSSACGDKDVLELFDIVSGLKLAYVQLQEAHLPYDPDRIRAVDKLVVARLEALCKIKRGYKEKHLAKAKLKWCHLDCLKAEIGLSEKLLGKLKSESNAKDAEIQRLQIELQYLNSENAIMSEKMKQGIFEHKKLQVLNVDMFQDTFKQAYKSIHDFSKPIISLMKASGWDLDLAVNSIESGVTYSRRCHKKYAFEAYIVRRMFSGELLKSHIVDDVLRYTEPMDFLMENPDSGFGNFCTKKYLLVVHPMLEMSFFGNLDQRVFLLSGNHPRTLFYQIFARMAKWIWVLQGIAKSIDPKATIFAVNRGCEFSDVYMESVEESMEAMDTLSKARSNRKVELMIMPGFKIGDTIVKSRVYATDSTNHHRPC